MFIHGWLPMLDGNHCTWPVLWGISKQFFFSSFVFFLLLISVFPELKLLAHFFLMDLNKWNNCKKCGCVKNLPVIFRTLNDQLLLLVLSEILLNWSFSFWNWKPVKEGDPVSQEERIQKDRCIEVYCETLRQRNSHKTTKVRKAIQIFLCLNFT